MKNLKRILSLALAGTMLVGMMMVGASAADFTDADKIEHKEAAATLAALGVMVGSPQADGTMVFNPEGKLDRAAMAKMIAVIMNKGADPLWADTDKPSFTDVKAGAWYVPYIEYCANFGYVSGYGNGVFGPADELSATQAARMILNAMGYKWDGKGDWKLATEVQARELGLYNGLDGILPNEVMSRDSAAQMLNTALNAPIANAQVVTTYVYDLTKTSDPNYLETFDSAAEASAYAQGNGLTSGQYAITRRTVNNTESLGGKNLGLLKTPITINTVTPNSDGTYTAGGYTTDVDLSQYMGQTVTVLYKNDADKTVFGVIPQGSVVFTGTFGDLDASKLSASNKKIKLAGTEYKADAATLTTTGWNGATVTPNNWDVLIAVDKDNDGDVDALLVKPVIVSKVNNVAKDGKVTVANVNLKDGVPQAIDPAKNNVAEGLKRNDFVVSTVDIKGVWTVAKADTVKNVKYTKQTSAGYVIGGVTYKDSATLMSGKNVGSQAYDLVVYGGYIFDIQNAAGAGQTVADLANVVYVLKTAASAVEEKDDFGASYTPARYTAKVQILKQDNSKATVDVTKVNGTAIANGTHGITEGLWIMTTDDKGVIDLTAPTAANLDLDAAVVAAGDGIDKGKIGNTRIDDNAVVFMKVGTDVKCLDGKTVAGWTVATKTNNFVAASSKAFTDKASNGFNYLTLGLLVAGTDLTTWPGTVNDFQYGYITAKATTEFLEKDSEAGVTADGTYYRVSIWDGTNDTDYLTTTNITGWAEKGAFVKFQVKDGKVLNTVTEMIGTTEAITAWNGSEYATASGKAGNVKANSHITIYVDSKNTAKADEAEINFADQSLEEGVDYVNNVYLVKDGGTTILFVDVNNEMQNIPEYDWNDIKALAPGFYTGAQICNVDPTAVTGVSAEPEKYLLFFVYTGSANTCTLKVGTTQNGAEVNTQDFTCSDTNTHAFVMDVRVSSTEQPIKDGALIEMVKGTTYYYTVDNGTNCTGSFVY